jgi:hypothetical protein
VTYTGIITWFIIGLIIGGCLGVTTTCILVAASIADDKMEDQYK